ncbi:MAG: VTT domain-containing protein, partial [Lysobacterales bacterium]
MSDSKGLNWKTWRWETVGSYAFLVVALVFAVIALGDAFEDHVMIFENWLAAHGYWALIIAVVLYTVLAALFVPDTLLGLIVGASFGFTRGIIIAVVASLIAASVEYLLAHRLLKPLIDKYLGKKPGLKAMQKAVKEQEFKLQFLIRLTPINRAVTSYVLGASGVRFPGFIMAAAGFLPHLCLEVYSGYAGKHLALMSGQT